MKSYGPEKVDYFWMMKPHHFEYQKSFRVVIYCTFSFNDFPFDHHHCDFIIKSIAYTTIYLELKPPILIYEGKTLEKINHMMKINQSRLPFYISAEILEPFHVFEDGFNYSHTGMRLHFERKNFWELIGGFYFPTTSFSILSLLSFSIQYEKVYSYKKTIIFHHIQIIF